MTDIQVCIFGSDATTSRPCILGVAVFDSQRIQLCEFLEAANASLPTLESLLLQMQPTSVVAFSASKVLAARLLGLAKQLEVPECRVADYGVEGGIGAAEADLARLAIDGDITRLNHIPKEENAMKAFSGLVSHFSLLSDSSLFRSCSIESLPVSGLYMRLDRACYTALNLLPPNPSESRKNTSLYGLLNKCRTSGGLKKLTAWIRQPLVDYSALSRRHDIVSAFIEAENVRQKIQTHVLSKVVDLEKILVKFRKEQLNKSVGGVSLEDLKGVYEAVVAAQNLLELLESMSSTTTVESELIQPLRQVAHDFEGFMRMIDTCLDKEACNNLKYQLARTYNTELGRLAEKRDQVEGKMEKLRVSMSKKTGVDSIKVSDALAPYHLAFRVVKRYQQDITSSSEKSIKQVQMNKAEYLFTTSDLIELVEVYRDVEQEYNAASVRLINAIVKDACTYHPVLAKLSDLLATVDVLTSFALASSIWKMVRPQVSMDRSIELEAARHVIIEARQIETGSRQQFIPNNVSLADETNLQIITGPNMGGKSTYIRTAALCALMNQIGCFVPCKTAKLPIFSNIFCRVGACDEQLRGVSTFMQEMLEAACIVKTADENSLVIIDELGRGTSTSEGFGLAWAIANDLKKRVKCFTLFATHYLELSRMTGAINRHATAMMKDGHITFLYEIKDGVAEKSYGTHVAKLAGYPQEVIEAAEERLSKRQKVIS